MNGFTQKQSIPTASDALAGRSESMPVARMHFVLDTPMEPDSVQHLEFALFGMGCFWGIERRFWEIDGVYSSAVGYAGGHTPNPNYQEVCSGLTGHNEVARVAFDPALVSYPELLRVFWEEHDPTQGMRQGNDIGTQYRSAVFVENADQLRIAEHSRSVYQGRLTTAGYGAITTEIRLAPPFYYAEEYHQQYLAKNPAGYCGLGGTGIRCSVEELPVQSE